jgi:hypothetical protein
MRKVITVGCGVAAAVLVGAQGLLGQGDDTPFHVRGERGELVHVLPSPDIIRNKSDKHATFAPPSDVVQVFGASYGSGNLIDHGGAEMSHPQVRAIFWNASVASDTAASLGPTIQAQIEAFLARYGTNLGNYPGTDANQSDFSIVQQYGSHSPIDAGFTAVTPSFIDLSTSHANWPATATVSDTQIQSYLASLIAGGAIANDPTVIYGVYFPKGTKVTLSTSASCTSFCAYHNHFTATGGTQIKYAAFPYLNCSGCSLAGLAVADMLTLVTSHELRESVTDPGDNNLDAWYDRVGYEADDKCAWHNLYQMTNGGFWVQPEYSNGGTVRRANFPAGISFPGPGCVVPNTVAPPPRKHR